MDPQKTAQLKEALETRKKELIERLESIGHRAEGAEGKNNNFSADFPDYGDSAEDNAVEVADYATNLSFERDLEKELNDIETALVKITDGSYGFCANCGQAIEAERLSIRPESITCVKCKKN